MNRGLGVGLILACKRCGDGGGPGQRIEVEGGGSLNRRLGMEMRWEGFIEELSSVSYGWEDR